MRRALSGARLATIDEVQTAVMPTTAPLLGLLVAIISFGYVFAEVIRKLVSDWATDDDYSHGFLIVPVAAYFAWERRDALRTAVRRPSVLGLLVVAASMGLLVMGILGAELFLSRVALIGVVVGCVLFVLGWEHLRTLAFPLAFLLLMVPIPAIIFNQIAFPLQLLASQSGQAGLNALQIPVLREGNIIMLASTTLEVAEACSGIRSLVSLLTLGIVFGYFVDSRTWMRTVLALVTVPIAVVSNGLRVAGTGVAAHYYGADAAAGFMHTFSGWLVFVVAIAFLAIVHRVLVWVFPQRPRQIRHPLAEERHVAVKA
jgi:exosortase